MSLLFNTYILDQSSQIATAGGFLLVQGATLTGAGVVNLDGAWHAVLSLQEVELS